MGLSQGALAKVVGVTQPTISALERNESTTSYSIGSFAHALNVSALWLETGLGEKKPTGQPSGLRRTFAHGTEPEYRIDFLPSSRGSCGGNASGKPDVADIQKAVGRVYKDQAFFDRLGVKPDDVRAVIADGDSGANFIVHGDTVLIHTTQTDRLENGLIYVLDTPDGPRIKRVFRRSDGHVILSCDNPDKVRYPDEEYTADKAASLMLIGRYIYRQG
jgi:phage repressor protein C with HTH and peptisase S24 domain